MAWFCTRLTRMTTSMSGMSNSPACQPASTKSRANLRCGPLSRTGR